MAGPGRFELPNASMEGVVGIGPTRIESKSNVLPLNYTPSYFNLIQKPLPGFDILSFLHHFSIVLSDTLYLFAKTDAGVDCISKYNLSGVNSFGLLDLPAKEHSLEQ